jgi:class 3 adenylate cyclase
MEAMFLYKLYSNKTTIFRNIFIFIWIIFSLIKTIELFEFIDKYNIHIYYLMTDIIGKITTNLIINDYNEKELQIINNIDLQTINFISYMLGKISKYYANNKIITEKCENFMNFVKLRFIQKIPENKDNLKSELLRKILPFNFENKYINNGLNDTRLNNDGLNNDKLYNKELEQNTKQFSMICILFTDIVNYTELAKKYDDKIIFQLLNSLYNKFDNIIKKYSHLQKVETIGDAYMVVGDIYRQEDNHKDVIKEIILLGLDFIKGIKTIKTPDKIPLSIRIGINIGTVSIGILGNEIPRLCVVGNAVNVASRLQSTADIDTIQMSRHIYEKFDEIDFGVDFNVIQKESVFLKNIGSVITYNITPKLHPE